MHRVGCLGHFGSILIDDLVEYFQATSIDIGEEPVALDPKLLSLLICPRSRLSLSLADKKLLRKLNGLVAEGKLHNEAGKTVTDPFEAGLVNEDQSWFYPIVDGIPIMLADEAFLIKDILDE
jgi:uncharacterized protein YbaR (Trm112 family)